MNIYDKDPVAVLDYQFDWRLWLDDGETISTADITISGGPTGDGLVALSVVGSATIDTGVVTFWLTGGENSYKYVVACKITTNQSRTDERSVLINCIER